MEISSLDVHTNKQINECVVLLRDILGEDLLGCYLYGSSIVGGLQRYSDIDMFVVSKRPTSLLEKEQIEKKLLSISGVYGSTAKRPIELTIVVLSDLNPWRYPPSFDFQYGDWLRDTFEKGIIEPWESKVKPDLAIVITQVLLTGKRLYGPDAGELLPVIPYADFMRALTEELTSVRGDLDWDTRNVLLTLARMWCTAATDTIQSKEAAARWAIGTLPDEYKPVMDRTLAILIGDQDDSWADLQPMTEKCADFMVGRIREQMGVILSRNNSKRKISVAI